MKFMTLEQQALAVTTPESFEWYDHAGLQRADGWVSFGWPRGRQPIATFIFGAGHGIAVDDWRAVHVS